MLKSECSTWSGSREPRPPAAISAYKTNVIACNRPVIKLPSLKPRVFQVVAAFVVCDEPCKLRLALTAGRLPSEE